MLLVDRLGGVEQMPDARTRASALVLRDVNHVCLEKLMWIVWDLGEAQ